MLQTVRAVIVGILAVTTFAFVSSEHVRFTRNGLVKGVSTAEGQSYLGIPYGKAERLVILSKKKHKVGVGDGGG